MNFFDIIKSVYQKNKLNYVVKYDTQLCITLNKWLGFDQTNISTIKKLLPYLFYVEPKHYYYLLFFSIPKRFNVPFFKKIPKVIQKDNKLLKKLQYVLGWSRRELEFNKPILEKVILNNEKYWESQLGVRK